MKKVNQEAERGMKEVKAGVEEKEVETEKMEGIGVIEMTEAEVIEMTAAVVIEIERIEVEVIWIEVLRARLTENMRDLVIEDMIENLGGKHIREKEVTQETAIETFMIDQAPLLEIGRETEVTIEQSVTVADDTSVADHPSDYLGHSIERVQGNAAGRAELGYLGDMDRLTADFHRFSY